MKSAIFAGILLSALTFSSPVLADGFKCIGATTGLAIAVFNHTQASEGTRSPAVLVVSNPQATRNNRTIASFSGDDETLEYQGYGAYVATVSPKAAAPTTLETAGDERNLAGASLAETKSIALTVDFSYASGTARLARVTESIPAKISYLRIDGSQVDETADCTRYLRDKSEN